MADVQHGRRRLPVDKARIASRVFPDVTYREGVQPLNPGFFQIEAARNAKVAKKRDAVTKRVRG